MVSKYPSNLTSMFRGCIRSPFECFFSHRNSTGLRESNAVKASAFPHQKGKALGSIAVLFPQARSSLAPPSGARQFAQQPMVEISIGAAIDV